MQHSWILGAAALQSACSLLIEVDDGLDGDVEVGHSQGGSTSDPDPPEASAPDATASGSGGEGVGGSAGSDPSELDGGVPEPDGGDGGAEKLQIFDLAFIEDSEEADATLRLVNSSVALSSEPTDDEEPPWRISLHPANQAGDVLDFAWSPDGERIAVRYASVNGPQIAIFAAPDWKELPRTEASSPATLPDLEATANYRWSPSNDALAVEISHDDGPMLGGYLIEGAGAFGLPPVAFAGPIETMDWRSATSLYVIQPQDDEPELIELQLSQRAFEPPQSVIALGLFFPLNLRHVPGGVIAASDDDANFLFFWPASPEEGAEAAFLPSSYLSAGQSFVAEVEDTPEALIYPIGDSASFVETVPDCPKVLAWTNGPDRRSLAGSKLACLALDDTSATVVIHSYDANGSRTATVLDDETLRADFASTDNWEGHARVFSSRGEFLALASEAHDILIDLRDTSPTFQIADSAAQGDTARSFSPSGQALLQQRGRRVDFVVLPAPGLSPEPYSLPNASADLPPCFTAHHALDWCGAPSRARRAAARWSLGSDVAALLAADEGLRVLVAVSDPPSIRRVPVSSCGASCVTQYEFGR